MAPMVRATATAAVAALLVSFAALTAAGMEEIQAAVGALQTFVRLESVGADDAVEALLCNAAIETLPLKSVLPSMAGHPAAQLAAASQPALRVCSLRARRRSVRWLLLQKHRLAKPRRLCGRIA